MPIEFSLLQIYRSGRSLVDMWNKLKNEEVLSRETRTWKQRRSLDDCQVSRRARELEQTPRANIGGDATVRMHPSER